MKSTLIKLFNKPTNPTNLDDEATDRAELQTQLTQLAIDNPLSLDEFLNPDDERVMDEDEDIFKSVVAQYSVDKQDEEADSSDGEEVEEVDSMEALRCLEILKLWKLQKGNTQDLQALDRVGREIVQYKSSAIKQSSIYRFFKPQN